VVSSFKKKQTGYGVHHHSVAEFLDTMSICENTNNGGNWTIAYHSNCCKEMLPRPHSTPYKLHLLLTYSSSSTHKLQQKHSKMDGTLLYMLISLPFLIFINPRRACAAITVLGLCVCLCVCVCVCVSVCLSPLILALQGPSRYQWL